MTTTPESTGLPSYCNDFSASSDGNDAMDASQCPLPSELSKGPALPNAAAGSSIGAAGPRDDGRPRNTIYYRRQVLPKRLHAERVSRPRYTVLIRPLNKVHVTDIPMQALTDAIEQSAPSAFIAEMAILRFDTTSNSIRITVRDEGHLRKLCTLSRLLATVNGNLRVFDVDTWSLQAHVTGSSHGAIKIRAGLTIEYIKAHLRCEQATITDVRMLGKTQLVLLTFDTERIPQRLVFEYEVIRIHEYQPRPVACYNCHCLCHVAKYCSFPPVCGDCGKPPHEVAPNCKQFPHCVACGASTHIALNPQCPQCVMSKAAPSSSTNSAYVTPPAHSEPIPTKQVSWAQIAASSDFSQLIASLRQEIQELRKENQRLRDLVMTLKKGNRSPTPRCSWSRNERKSRSPTRRVKPATDKDSAYSHVIGLLRQERAQESNKL
ncbi:hypothetical protein HPB49_013834 [Dermacentor silvarum]|uniref:Uncharacterized protein n=1 Tax=Dermacentor silvarum TaxID=543639 RepID=A0ACB8D5X9_DERSI|nr:hypothetical protein HPB49_013834 [Dermacentor silvarum]